MHCALLCRDLLRCDEFRHLDSCARPPAGLTVERELVGGSVHHGQTLADVGESDPALHGLPHAVQHKSHPVVLDLDDRAARLAEFSTNGCRIMLGTRIPNVSGPISFLTRSFGPNRMASMSRYSSIDSSSSRSVTKC